MIELVLEAKPRTKLGSRASRQIRKEGRVPLTLNDKSKPAVHLEASARELEKLLKQGARVMTLHHPGGKDKVFLKELQYDHLGEYVYHVVFTKVAMDQDIEMEVDLVLKGKPVGVVEDGGVLDQYIKIVKIACLPDSIPQKIEADVSKLKLGDHLNIENLKVPPGVKFLQDARLVLASVTEHKEAEAEPAEAGSLEPEVIAKEKAEEDASTEEGKKDKKDKKDKKEEKK